MPMSLPKVVSRCLGISSPNENSPPSSEGNSLAGEVTSVSHRAQTTVRVAASEPTSGPSEIAMTTMAADWRGSEIGETAAQTHASTQVQRRGSDAAAQAMPPAIEQATQDWADLYGVHTSQLIRLGNQCTRYGLIELGGHRFIVGPTATPGEARVLTRMLKARPQIGAIFCVEPGVMQPPADSAHLLRESHQTGYAERPIHEYFSSVIHRSPPASDAAATRAQPAPVPLDGGLSHVQFMEFVGMERFDAEIPREVLWDAGRGVAAFMRENPGKVAMVCSERGIARPCAVIASAALLLTNGDAALRASLREQVVGQRAKYSDHHINLAARSLDLIAEFARLLEVLRTPGRGDLDQERKIHLLKARLPAQTVGQYGDGDEAGDEARLTLAALLEDNFDRVSPALMSGGLPPDTAMLWLCDEFTVQRGVRFLTPSYTYGHVDRISQASIDPDHRNAIRLVSVDDDGLTCDNKYYDAASVADWYRHCRLRSNVMSNPVSRAPVVALLVHEGELARLEPLFRRGTA
ncbi:hypothetical protein PFI31113_04260 [Pandoraea fibrosis]|uniref:Uncharacterized protein n=2 Tax=Pandoraea fibrosis TaxID=1891094 RepID=A0A5E4Y5N7_9BURK|nr:hypothetical protein PFI31113_04260 [Pandoraea fibrosis]